MKKIIVVSMMLCVLMIVSSVSAASVDVGYAVPDTTNPFISWLTTTVKELAEADGISVQIADASANASTQISQVENFIAMKVKVLILMPVDPGNVQDVIQKAMDAGIKVVVAGADTKIYDVMMNTDQYVWGEKVAEMALEWIEENIEEENPKVIVIKYTGTPESSNRSAGIVDKLIESGKVNVVEATGETQGAAEAMSIIENMWQQNSDTVVICTYNADAAVGVNEYLMGLTGIDLSKIAVFSADTSSEVEEMINNSLKGESVFRGTTKIAGPEIDGVSYPLPEGTFRVVKSLIDGTYNAGSSIVDAIAPVLPAEEN